MKGFLDAPLAIPLILIFSLALFFGPPSIDFKIKQQFKINIDHLAVQDVLFSILSSTNTDTLTGKEKTTIEIIGEKAFLQSQKVDFLKEDLDKLLPNKCYVLEFGKDKLAEKKLTQCSTAEQKFETSIVLPYNPTKRTESIKLVIK